MSGADCQNYTMGSFMAFYDDHWCYPFILEWYVADRNGRSFLDYYRYVSLWCLYGGVGGSPDGLLSCALRSRMMLGYYCAFYDPWDQLLCHCGNSVLWWDLNYLYYYIFGYYVTCPYLSTKYRGVSFPEFRGLFVDSILRLREYPFCGVGIRYKYP